MFRKIIILSLVAILPLTNLSAQQPCSTDIQYHKLVEKYPQIAEYEKQFDEQMNAITNHGDLAKFGLRTSSTTDTTEYDIPIVVHVIHDYGYENIDDNVIYDAVNYYTTCYNAQNADTANVITPFKQYIGNARMRFHLATIDPNGKPTKGVTRFQSYLTFNADDGAKFLPWPQSKYINIWFINTFGAASTGAAAYAYLPSMGASIPYYDGVIALYSYANYAKCIPHELGHVLNLWHPWGNSNNPGVACGDDGVDDTPPTMGHSPVGCVPTALYDTTCATGYMKTYLSMDGTVDSLVDYPDTTNAQNIMDYTYCQDMFTKGQVVRMRTALRNTTANRNNLFSPSNLAATGALVPMPDLPPIADYIVNRANGSGIITDSRNYFLAFNSPLTFQFSNKSWNDTISDVLWNFSNGATNTTSTSMTTVSNQFSVPGWVTVTIIANSNAGSDTLINRNAVYAADTTAIPATNYVQEFAASSDINNWPMFNYYNNQYKWQFYNGAGWGDNSCIRYRSYDTSNRQTGNAIGDHDDFFTPAFNLNGITDNLYLNFFIAGARRPSYTGSVGDSLEVEVSTNGGARWNVLAGYNSNTLATNGIHGTEFVPNTTTNWKPIAVSIPTTYRTTNTFFRFRFLPGDLGNNLYLDNFYFYPYPAGVKETMNTDVPVNIYPNPSANGTNIVFKTGNTGLIKIVISDITGKTIFEINKTYIPGSIQQEYISRNLLPSAGIYLVNITIDGVSKIEKMSIY